MDRCIHERPWYRDCPNCRTGRPLARPTRSDLAPLLAPIPYRWKFHKIPHWAQMIRNSHTAAVMLEATR